MRKIASLGAAAVLLATAVVVTPAFADGFGGWRKAPPALGGSGPSAPTSFTPDYFPYYGSAYSYNGPNYDPIPYRCWRWRHGYRYWIC